MKAGISLRAEAAFRLFKERELLIVKKSERPSSERKPRISREDWMAAQRWKRAQQSTKARAARVRRVKG